MKTAKIPLAAALSAALLLSLCPAARAAAPAAPAEKEEVVYINLDPNGRVETVDVVNIFDLAEPGQIVDYGPYSAVRNMTTMDPVELSGDTVTVQAGAGRLYYEGALADAAIPWRFDIRYLMDGREVAADKIAGMSGELEILLTVREDPSCAGDFFAGYALQASVTLDGDRCTEVEAPGATAANVGSDKQLTYTILPGKGADIDIKARVTDFSMDPIAINGVPLALDVEVDDEELMAQVTELLDAIEALDQGAQAIDEGVGELQDGAGGALQSGTGQLSQGAAGLRSGAGALKSGGSTVNDGAYAVSTGAAELNAGVQELNGGLVQLQTGLDTLAGRSAELTGGSAQILSALQQVQATVDGTDLTGDDVEQIRTVLTGVQTQAGALAASLAGVNTAIVSLTDLQQNYEALASALETAISTLKTAGSPPDTTALENVLTGLQNNNAGFATALGQMSGIADAAAALETDLEAIGSAAAALAAHVDVLPGVLAGAKSDVDTLVGQYATLDAGIQAYVQGVADAAAGAASLTAGGAALAQGSATLAEGAGELYGGTASLLNGIAGIYDATGDLTNGAGALNSGVAELLAGVAQLRAGTGEMADGTAEMAEKTDGMDQAVQDKIDELLKSVTGGEGEIVSFVSPKNTNVSAVQFVIRTPAIQKVSPAAPEPTPEPDETVWERLKDLFE